MKSFLVGPVVFKERIFKVIPFCCYGNTNSAFERNI